MIFQGDKRFALSRSIYPVRKIQLCRDSFNLVVDRRYSVRWYIFLYVFVIFLCIRLLFIGWYEEFVRRFVVSYHIGHSFPKLSHFVIGGGVWLDLNPNGSLELFLPVSGFR